MAKHNDKCFELADKIICLDYKEDEFFLNCYPLTDYLRKMKFKSTLKNCLVLLNNNSKVLMLIKHMSDMYHEEIIRGDFHCFTNDLILIDLIKAYCQSTGIVWEEKEMEIKSSRVTLLTKLEEEKLFTLYAREGGIKNSIKEIIILRNMELVKYWAVRYCQNDPNHSFEDFVSCGVIGLHKAINGFNVQNNLKFSTYATPKILREMRYLKNFDNSVHQANGFIALKNKCSMAEEYLAKELSRKPTISEIASYVDESEYNVILVYKKPCTCVSTFELQSGKKVNIFEVVPASIESDNDLKKTELKRLLAPIQFSEKQKQYLEARFRDNLTLEEIATMYGVTYQAVERSINNALFKIANSKNVTLLADYFSDKDEALRNVSIFVRKHSEKKKKEKEQNRIKYRLKKAKGKI